jgi:hypothetical protein
MQFIQGITDRLHRYYFFDALLLELGRAVNLQWGTLSQFL